MKESKAKSYVCGNCGKKNNISKSMRCSDCNALHDKDGELQTFTLTIGTRGGFEAGINHSNPNISEAALRTLLRFNSLTLQEWEKILESGKYCGMITELSWTKNEK